MPKLVFTFCSPCLFSLMCFHLCIYASIMFSLNYVRCYVEHYVHYVQFPLCDVIISRVYIQVQQCRVRETQRRVDPAGSVLRQLRTINLRQYHVDGPGALWHIDENHELIR